MTIHNSSKVIFIAAISCSLLFFDCKKFVTVNPPVTQVTQGSVYASDATAISVLTGVYDNLSKNAYGPGSFNLTNYSLFGGLSSDELSLYDQSVPSYISYYKNILDANINGYEFWVNIYAYLFTCNSAIDGLNNSTTLTPAVKKQLLGEAKFLRAFFYFYLVNLYGDAPLILETNYKQNSVLARTSSGEIYKQMVADLQDAEQLLSPGYVDGGVINSTTEKVRPTKWAAAALLARVFLFTNDWKDAESQSTTIINNTALYKLDVLGNVFLKNSNEAIWQLQPVTTGTTNTQDAFFFILPTTGPGGSWNVFLSNALVGSFEPGDKRATTWTNSVTVKGVVYYYPYKYKVNAQNAAVSEYLMLFRLGEQYLIRAEARAKQADIAGAQSDLNMVRTRAGLGNTTAADVNSIATAIMLERKVELFTEMGQRWFDLKRTGQIDSVMNVMAPQKMGASWHSYQKAYPLPLFDIQRDPNLIQNTGY